MVRQTWRVVLGIIVLVLGVACEAEGGGGDGDGDVVEAGDTIPGEDSGFEIDMAGPIKAHAVDLEPEEYDTWKDWAYEYYLESADLEPVGEPWALDMTVEDAVEEAEGVTRHLVSYTTFDGERVPAFLYIPDTDEPVPGVVVYHGHGKGKIRTAEGVGYAENAIASYLAVHLGYVVLTPDTRSFGEFTMGDLGHSDYAYGLYKDGELFTSKVTLDGMADLWLLQGMEEVQEDTIAIAGISGGCWRTLNVAAYSQMATAAVCNGLFIDWSYLFSDKHCLCQWIPDLADAMTMVDLGALIIPGGLMIQWGAEDSFYPQGKDLLPLIESVYTTMGLEDSFLIDINEGYAHQFENADVATYLHSQLGDGAWPYEPPEE